MPGRYLIVVLLALLSLPSTAAPLSMRDFASGVQLEPTSKGAIYAVPIPREVYAGVERQDLADLALFDREGNLVAMTIVPPEKKSSDEDAGSLPLFPLPRALSRDGSLRVSVRTDASGTVIGVDEKKRSVAGGGALAYLVDTGPLRDKLVGLRIVADGSGKGFMAQIRVEASNDLDQWWPVVDQATVGHLLSGKDRLESEPIRFPSMQGRYLRLTLVGEGELPPIQQVRGIVRTVAMSGEREWQSISLQQESEGVYLFSLPGPMPVDRLRIKPASGNGILRVNASSRTEARAPWLHKLDGSVYRLQQGVAVLERSELELYPCTDRFWRLQVQDGTGRGTPQVEVGWNPHRLLFVAQGEGPYTLAFGSGRKEGQAGWSSDLARLATELEKRGELGTVRATSVTPLGGEGARRHRLSAADSRRWLVTAALLAGVLLLALMARSLYRQAVMKNATDDRGGKGV